MVVAGTCLLVLFTKKTTYEQFSAVYLAPKSGTDGFTSMCQPLLSSRQTCTSGHRHPPRGHHLCLGIFVFCDLNKKIFSNVLEQRQFKNLFHTILEQRQFRTKPTDHSKEGRIGKRKLGNSAHDASSGASALERVRSATDDNQVQPGFMCFQVFKIH